MNLAGAPHESQRYSGETNERALHPCPSFPALVRALSAPADPVRPGAHPLNRLLGRRRGDGRWTDAPRVSTGSDRSGISRCLHGLRVVREDVPLRNRGGIGRRLHGLRVGSRVFPAGRGQPRCLMHARGEVKEHQLVGLHRLDLVFAADRPAFAHPEDIVFSGEKSPALGRQHDFANIGQRRGDRSRRWGETKAGGKDGAQDRESCGARPGAISEVGTVVPSPWIIQIVQVATAAKSVRRTAILGARRMLSPTLFPSQALEVSEEIRQLGFREDPARHQEAQLFAGRVQSLSDRARKEGIGVGGALSSGDGRRLAQRSISDIGRHRVSASTALAVRPMAARAENASSLERISSRRYQPVIKRPARRAPARRIDDLSARFGRRQALRRGERFRAQQKRNQQADENER